MLTMSMGAYSGEVDGSGNYSDKITTINKDLRDVANRDIKLIEKLGLTAEYLQQIAVNNDNMLTYVYQFGEVTALINVEQNFDFVSYSIQEGLINNVLVLFNNGEVIVDGKSIDVTNSVQYSNNVDTMNNNDIQTRDADFVDDYWTEVCPYGSPSDYGDFVDIIEESNVQFKNSLENLAITAIIGILTLKIKPLAALATSVLTTLALSIQNKAPYSSSASFKSYVYLHSENGYWVDNTSFRALAVRKHSMYLYPLCDYEGNSTHIVEYECKEL